MSITANRHPQIRAALVDQSADDARVTRQHNNSNVLCLAANHVDAGDVAEIVDAFLSTRFEGGRHERRVEKLEQLGSARLHAIARGDRPGDLRRDRGGERSGSSKTSS